MIKDLQDLLGVNQDKQRVMTVTQRLANHVRVELNNDYVIVSGNYDVGTRLIISSGNVIGIVGKSAGTFYID